MTLDDIFDAALSADALRKAANEGEVAAQTLLVFAAGQRELAALMKAALTKTSAVAKLDPTPGRGSAAEPSEGRRRTC
jgi:hypothetical protein